MSIKKFFAKLLVTTGVFSPRALIWVVYYEAGNEAGYNYFFSELEAIRWRANILRRYHRKGNYKVVTVLNSYSGVRMVRGPITVTGTTVKPTP